MSKDLREVIEKSQKYNETQKGKRKELVGELVGSADKFPARLKVWYTVDRPPASGWHYSTGFITAEMIQAHLPPPGEDTLILMCGPPPMLKFACRPNLEKLGHPEARVLAF